MASNFEVEHVYQKYVSLLRCIAGSTTDHSKGLGATEGLASLVEGLTRDTKMLIGFCLKASEKSPRPFLDEICLENFAIDLNYYKSRMSSLSSFCAETCFQCNTLVEGHCFRTPHIWPQAWHIECLRCSNCYQDAAFANEEAPYSTCCNCGASRAQAISYVTRLEQYRHLLWAALARRMAIMKMDFDALDDIDLFDDKVTRDGNGT